MREVVLEGRECNVCGSRVVDVYARVPSEAAARGALFVGARGASHVGARGASSVGAFERESVARAPRARSGLAHAAGFAGVLFLFGRSLAGFALFHWSLVTGASAWLAFACGLFAPVAFALAFASGVSLDRSREKSGALPALFGLVVGLWGTFEMVLAFEAWLRYLKAF